MKIEITWADLVEGDRGVPSHCAIARAINRMYPHYTNVTVGTASIRLNDKKRRLKFMWATPAAARDFIAAFDGNGASTEPGLTFDLFEHNAIKHKMGPVQPGVNRTLAAERKAQVKSQVLESVGAPAGAAAGAKKKPGIKARRYS